MTVGYKMSQESQTSNLKSHSPTSALQEIVSHLGPRFDVAKCVQRESHFSLREIVLLFIQLFNPVEAHIMSRNVSQP